MSSSDRSSNESSDTADSPQSSMDSTLTTTTCASSLSNSNISSQILLATALVRVFQPSGHSITLRALLDQGSQSSFISESAVQALGLKKRKVDVQVAGIGSTHTAISKSCVSMQCVSSYDTSQAVDIEALLLPKVTSLQPISNNFADTWRHITNLQLTDQNYCQQDRIELLLGADVYGRILLSDIRRGPPGLPTAQQTIFGWVLSGQLFNSTNVNPAPSKSTFNSHFCVFFENQLKQPIEIEEGYDRRPFLPKDKQICAEFLEVTCRIDLNGRFGVRLLVNDMHKINSNLIQQSPTVINISGHDVRKESRSITTSEAVFDASRNNHRSKSNLSSIEMRTLVFTTKIVQMIWQFDFDKRDWNLQQNLWLKSIDYLKLNFRLTNVTYLATKIFSINIDNHHYHDICAPFSLRDFYNGNVATRSDNDTGIREVQRHLNDILTSEKIVLRKWSMNKDELCLVLPPNYLLHRLPFVINLEKTITTVKIFWSPAVDYVRREKKLIEESLKRQLHFNIACPYDALGWLVPRIVRAKLMIPNSRRFQLNWDDHSSSNLTNSRPSFREKQLMVQLTYHLLV